MREDLFSEGKKFWRGNILLKENRYNFREDRFFVSDERSVL